MSVSLRPCELCPWDFPGKSTGVGLPFPSPGDLPDPGVEPGSPTLQADALPPEPPGKSLELFIKACYCVREIVLKKCYTVYWDSTERSQQRCGFFSPRGHCISSHWIQDVNFMSSLEAADTSLEVIFELFSIHRRLRTVFLLKSQNYSSFMLQNKQHIVHVKSYY